jgi:hypothetical protein
MSRQGARQQQNNGQADNKPPSVTIQGERVRVEMPLGPVRPYAEIDPQDPTGNSNSGVGIDVGIADIEVGIGADGVSVGGSVGIGGGKKGGKGGGKKEGLKPPGGIDLNKEQESRSTNEAPGVTVEVGGGVTISPGAILGIPGEDSTISVEGSVSIPGASAGFESTITTDGCTITTTINVLGFSYTHTYRNPKCDEKDPSSPPPGDDDGGDGGSGDGGSGDGGSGDGKGSSDDWNNYDWGDDENDCYMAAIVLSHWNIGESFVGEKTESFDPIWFDSEGKVNILAGENRESSEPPSNKYWGAALASTLNRFGFVYRYLDMWAWKGENPYNGYIYNNNVGGYQIGIFKSWGYNTWVKHGFAPTPQQISFPGGSSRPTFDSSGFALWEMQVWKIPDCNNNNEPEQLFPRGSPSPSPGGGGGSPSPSGNGNPQYNPPPKKMDNCCKETASMLRKIMKVLAVDEIDKNGFLIGNRLMMRSGGNAVTQNKTYPQIIECLIRIMANGMIFEPDLNIKDASSTTAGNQALKVEYVNASAWAKAIGEMVYEIMDDGNASTNIELRTGITVTQTLVALVDVVRKLDAVLDALGVQLVHTREEIQTAFDLTGGEKAFDSKGEVKTLDKLKDEDTESLLPAMLQGRKNVVKTVKIHPKADSIVELLEEINSKLKNLSD